MLQDIVAFDIFSCSYNWMYELERQSLIDIYGEHC